MTPVGVAGVPPDERLQRARILDAALTLVSDLGAAGTSMRRLASTCGLNVATIYHYFPSKADLYVAVVEEVQQRLQADYKAVAAQHQTLLDRHRRWYIAGRDPRWLRRNALVVLGNIGDRHDVRVVETLARYRHGDDEILAEHARWASDRLGLTPPTGRVGAVRQASGEVGGGRSEPER